MFRRQSSSQMFQGAMKAVILIGGPHVGEPRMSWWKAKYHQYLQTWQEYYPPGIIGIHNTECEKNAIK